MKDFGVLRIRTTVCSDEKILAAQMYGLLRLTICWDGRSAQMQKDSLFRPSNTVCSGEGIQSVRIKEYCLLRCTVHLDPRSVWTEGLIGCKDTAHTKGFGLLLQSNTVWWMFVLLRPIICLDEWSVQMQEYGLLRCTVWLDLLSVWTDDLLKRRNTVCSDELIRSAEMDSLLRRRNIVCSDESYART